MIDEQLICRLQAGDTRAFDELYDRHSPRLLGYLRRMVGDSERAQDLLHDVFLRLVERCDRIDTQRPFSRWLYSVAHNLCCSELRHSHVRRDKSNDLSLELRFQVAETQPLTPDHGLDDERFLAALDSALANLEPERRSVFVLRHAHQWPIAQISEAVGCPEGTVKSRLFHATRALAASLRPFDPTGPTP
ncbi:MAG: RNA polymerase sigma factor [Gemmatimonadetes bacterium]|jgi:RNA polymerase sigma-70 factor (ECF subfamily)|nr:RNA polymerase sigma factor [Gemmatimonadota bacterium]MBT5058328.1 RNA polymerase sigma factor [Gemmatimonadota bacterium]MBT5141469.1 RNA polymerase sigma factor [Gemmatimonadota bacterium]MBT5590702.1 RNA polymerase sigma factor [Gemmatimonadota bacterium]MBT5965163.1 RNA polymerase sigma factor [Gemmatimonadota bacterium]